MGKDENVLVTGRHCWEMSNTASTGGQGEKKVLEWAWLLANEDCYLSHLPLEEWAREIQPQFRNRDIAVMALLKRPG